jgi:hypothetical protein
MHEWARGAVGPVCDFRGAGGPGRGGRAASGRGGCEVSIAPPTIKFYGAGQALADAAVEILEREQPMTLRSLFYQVVSAGHLPSTDPQYYQKLAKVMGRLRENGRVPLSWIVDHVRSTLKPSSWSGLADFADTVRSCYRKDFWAEQDECVELFVEKDAIAGALQPITHQYDVPIRVCRGYASIGFAGEIAVEWSQIEKPICAYYIGDHDPSGHDIERDLIAKLERYSGKSFGWERLGALPGDIDTFNLIPLEVKRSDMRSAGFVRQYGTKCVEVDALPPTELRGRIENAILSHVNAARWDRLQQVERIEQESIDRVAAYLKSESSLGLGGGAE